MKYLRRLYAAWLTVALALGACAPTPPPATPPRADEAPPTLVLISLDGFRRDYFEVYSPPAVSRLAREGVIAEAMIPAFPSLSFPNHYTLATGLYPEEHGIVANTMYDPVFDTTFTLSGPGPRQARWWGGEPIWATAQKQGLTAFTFFWPGTEAEIAGVRPARWQRYDGRVPFNARVDSVLTWLDLPARPHLITLYFEEPDRAGHDHGPFSAATRAGVLAADSAVARLDAGLRARRLEDRVNLIVVSDHGMAATSNERVVYIEDVIDPSTIHIVNTSPVLMVRPRGADTTTVVSALRRLPHVTTWLRSEVPERLHFTDHRRITPIVGLAEEGWTIQVRRGNRPPGAGMHGYDNALASMRALFVARGPSFRKGATIPPFENVNVYALLARLLNLRPAANSGRLTPFERALR